MNSPKHNASNKAILYALVAVFASLFAPIAIADTKSDDLLKQGPYPVGVTTRLLTDSSRTDSFTKRARQLVTEIWYPAADSARQKPSSKLSDFFPGGLTPDVAAALKNSRSLDVEALDKTYAMLSHRDAPIRRGKYPVIIFSHGNGGFRYQNTFWCDYLASRGYIIVSADHTGNSAVTVLPEGPVLMQPKEMGHSAADRPKDVSFLLDTVIAWNNGSDPQFKSHIDCTRPCAAGMSFGSMTAVKVGDTDPRFKCVIAMSGAFPEHTNRKIPTLWMIGTEDRTIGTVGNSIVRGHHQKQEGPSFLLELKNGGHFSFTDIMRILPNYGDGAGVGKRREGGEAFQFTSMEKTYAIVNSYSLAFLNIYVKGQKSYGTYLNKNGWPDELIWDSRGLDLDGDSK